MGKRQPQTYSNWNEELQYIKMIAESKDLSCFNWKPQCFEEYVQMQSNFAKEDGYVELATNMLLVLNTFIKETSNV